MKAMLVITVIIKNTNAVVYDAVIFFGPGWVKQFWAKSACQRGVPNYSKFWCKWCKVWAALCHVTGLCDACQYTVLVFMIFEVSAVKHV